jgi:choline kinase
MNIATGYLRMKKFNMPQIKKKFYNPKFETTNMVVSLFSAIDIMEGDDLLITYGDIVYNKHLIDKVLADNSKISVVVDRNWRCYWESRMENPLEDAESLRLNNKGEIIELGKKVSHLDDIQGQYIGIVKIRKDFVRNFIDFYNKLDRYKLYDGNNFNNMYMTSFLQKITDDLVPLKPIFINNGWMEVDEPSDLLFTKFLNA